MKGLRLLRLRSAQDFGYAQHKLFSKELVQVLLTALVLGIVAGFPWFSGVAYGLVPEDGRPVVFPTPPAASTPAPDLAEPQTTQIIVDDLDSGFDLYGPSNGWHHSSSTDTTYSGHAYWTYTTDTWGNQNNWATWTVSLPESGLWEVFAYIPYVITGRYDTTRARYQIQSADGYYVVERDQNNNTGWVSLGAYNFNAGTNYFVRLEDVTPDWSFIYNGQRYRKTIKFDAIKWVQGGGGPPAAGVDIWVDRGEGAVYYVGEPIRVCYSVSRPIYIKIYDCQPGQPCRVILEGHDDGRGDCRNYTVTPPTGWETLRIEAIEDGQVVAQDETYFFVTQGVDTEPPPGYCRVRWLAATSNDCSGEFGLYSPQRVTLFSDYKYHPSPDVREFGPFNPDTSLVFYIRPWSFCGPAEYLSTSANAHITELGTNHWQINWEDLPPDRADDYDDLIVEVECGIQPPCQDGAEFVGQSPYPTVQPGQAFQIYFEVRNSGSCTWRQGEYYLANINGTPLGANPRQELGSDVSPGATKRWTLNMTAPTTPGTYRTQWMLKHGDNTFGPNMYIDVTVAPACTPGANGVVLYEHPSYQGRCITLTADDPDLGDNNFNDIASSIRLVGSYATGWEAVVYEHTYYGGGSSTFRGNDPDFGNDAIGHDRASSIRIRRSTYSISGRVTDPNNNAIFGVTISDGAGHTVTTDGNGNYTFSGLSAGTYILTPSKSGYTFSPGSRTVSVPPSATGQDFTARPVGPNLVLTAFTVNPAQPTVFQTNYINFTITNRGGARFQPPSGGGYYTVQVVLKKPGVGKLEEYHYVTLQPLSLSPLHALNPGESQHLQITDVFFFNAVSDAEIELFFQPDRALNLRNTILSKPITINPHPDNAWNCAASIAKVLVLALNAIFPETLGAEAAAQAFLNMPAMFLKWQACGSDLICGAKAIAQYLLAVIGTVPAKLINLLADLSSWFTSPAPLCSSWLDYITAIVKEWIRNGIPINLVGVQSPVYVLVTDSQGRRAGFLDNGTIVQEIPGSRVVESPVGKVVVYPGDTTQTARVKGTDYGTMRLSLVLVRDAGASVSVTYQNVQVFPTTTGVVDVRDSTYTLNLDDNGDGATDRRRLPDEVVISGPQSVYLPFLLKDHPRRGGATQTYTISGHTPDHPDTPTR